MQFRPGWWILPLVVLNIAVLAVVVSAIGFLATVAGLIGLSLVLAGIARVIANEAIHNGG
ncbi:hypothetical protein [Paenirhodobacter populi]|uniref:Uncharacterized protein n=1 Tax=Paenirhodobacter populi TaxID=2306993 RepID=A0A443IPW8_9RHOB|nr:hypothetical protein [Sinirhodobacter populi]RWR06016.1 hypothetical protein D2T32_15010 [Sinirhodobacter populi]RWR07876.1 hypothetical protein D2T33_16335 [Sinirhodobacter populi]RWR27839.1 hypothetical protein D2T29_17780 [Sinirhodobacter populi]